MILRVLLATAERELAESVRRAVGAPGVLLTQATDPHAFWEHLASAPCDLAVVDARLPDLRPGRSMARIRELPQPPEVLVLGAGEDADRNARWIAAGARAVVASGIAPERTQEAVAALAQRTRELAQQAFRSREHQRAGRLSDFASESPAMREFLRTVRKVVDSPSSLLVLGETGVGKEYLARAIHEESNRAAKPFVAVNCAALPESLLESELFGHVAGAFTGAQHARRGYFELAHTGTLFLDEIGELTPALQVKLLRVLQDRRIQPVGSERAIEIDVRVITATNRELEADVAAKRFRADLYYRLAVVTLTVPPLRARREDVPDLVTSHVEHFRRILSRPVSGVRADAMELLLRHPFPGNVRELMNMVERAVLLAEGEEITPGDLPHELQNPRPIERGAAQRSEPAPDPLALPYHEARERELEAFERRYVEALLSASAGRIGEAAARAGLTPRSLYEKMKRLGLRKESFRPRPLARATRDELAAPSDVSRVS